MSITYDVRIRYLTEGSPDKGLGNLKTSTDAWLGSVMGKGANAAASLAGSFNNAFDSVAGYALGALESVAKLGGAAVTAALGATVKEGLGFESFTESAALGMAGVKTMLGDMDPASALKEANWQMADMVGLAKELPGTLKELTATAGYLQPALIGLGVGAKDANLLAAHVTAAAAAVGVNQGVAGHEAAAILEGRATSRMPFVAKLGFHAKELNAMDPQKRLEALQQRLGKMGPMLEMYKKSWAGRWSNIQDSASQFAGAVARPLFGSLKGEMGRALDWLGNNQPAVDAFALRLGNGIDRAFHGAVAFVETWYEPVKIFGTNLYTAMAHAFRRVEPFLHRFETIADRFLRDPKALNKIGSTLGALAGLRGATGVLEHGMRALPALGGLGVGGAELALAAPVAAAGLLLLAGAVDGIVRTLSDASNPLHGFNVGQMEKLGETGADLTKNLHDLDVASSPLRDALGAGLLVAVSSGAKQLELFTGEVAREMEALKGLGAAAWHAASGLGSKAEGKQGVLGSYYQAPGYGRFDDDKDGSKIDKVPKHITNIGKVEVKVESGDGDPRRFAENFKKEIENLTKNPKTASGPLDHALMGRTSSVL